MSRPVKAGVRADNRNVLIQTVAPFKARKAAPRIAQCNISLS